MANLHCRLITGDMEGCDFNAHESNLQQAQADMLSHIQNQHPVWYQQLPPNQQQALPFQIMRHMENATAFI